MVIERIASLVGFVSQLDVAALAHVAVHVKVLLHGHDANRLFGALEPNALASVHGEI